MIFGLFGGEKKRVAEMIAAARSGDTEKIKQLLAKGADINAAEPESGDTPLLAAIDKDQWAAAEQLLKQHPELSLEDKNGHSPLYLAVSKGDSALTMVNLLLDAGAKVDLGPSKGDNAGATPLHIACATGANGCVESILRYGASATKQLPDGATPMHTAAIGGNKKTIELLHNAGADFNALSQEKRTPLHNCGVAGNASVAAALIGLGAEVNVRDIEGCTPLMHAVLENHIETAKVLLDNGADPNVIVRTDGTPLYPLYVAAMRGFDEMISLLLEKGVDAAVIVDGLLSPVDIAKHAGHESAAKLLAASIKRQRASAKMERETEELMRKLTEAWQQSDVAEIQKVAEARQFSKLSGAIRLPVMAVIGDLAGLKSLLASGSKPDVIAEAGVPEVHPIIAAAMRKGNVAVVQALLDAGANPNVQRADGSTALLISTSLGDTDAVKALLANRADPNIALPNGLTALITATVNGHGKVIDILIDAGADVNATMPDGQLGAFGFALDTKKMRIAIQLLRKGSLPNFGNYDTLPLAVAEFGSLELLQEIDARGSSNLAEFGARAAFVAARNKDSEVLDYLLNHGVDLASKNDLGYTPLILASLSNHPILVARYIARGDDCDAHDADGETALSLAIEKALESVIALLRKANAETKDYGTLHPKEAMSRAAQEGALGSILNLRDQGVSVNSTNDLGNTPLMLAAQNGHVGVVRSLYHLGGDLEHKNTEGRSASNLAKLANQEKVLKTLLEFGAEDAMHDVYGFNSPSDGGESRKTIDLGDKLMGRYSHPFKENLTYDESDTSDDLVTEEDEVEEPPSEEVTDEGSVKISDETSSKLDQLEQLINTPHIRDKLHDGHYEFFSGRINLIRSEGENSVPADELNKLFRMGEIFANQPKKEDLPPPLFEAATEGDIPTLRKLIKSGSDIHQTLPDGTTLLMAAAENGHNDIVTELIKHGIDVNQRREDTFAAFLIACFLGHDDVVKTLAKNGADVNAAYEIRSSQGKSGNQTALTVSAARGNFPMCTLLLKLGADLDIVSDSGYTPLMWSLVNGSSENVAELLLKVGANPDPNAESKIAISTSTTPLILASTNGMSAIVKALIKRNVAIDKQDGDGWTALKRASNEGHDEIVTLLLKAGASPDVKDDEDWTALSNAAGKGHVAICKALLKAGADVNATGARGRTPLLQAIGVRSDGKALDALKDLRRMLNGGDDEEDGDEESSLELIKILLKAGANPNVLHDGTSHLAEAIENDDEDLIKLLKKHGASESATQQSAGVTVDEQPESEEGKAFLAAAIQADAKRLKDLVHAGVDVNYISAQGQTALAILLAGSQDKSNSRMFRRNAEQCLDYLLSNGANPSIIGDPSPFVLAAMGQRLHLVQTMLAAGVDINQNIGEGQTALFMSLLAPDAGKPADDRCAVTLLKAGADSSLRHESGAMPIHLAAGSNYVTALQELLERRPQHVDVKTNIGITPLMMAATEGHADAVKILLKFGADLSLKDDEGETAKDVAIKNGNEELVPLLS